MPGKETGEWDHSFSRRRRTSESRNVFPGLLLAILLIISMLLMVLFIRFSEDLFTTEKCVPHFDIKGFEAKEGNYLLELDTDKLGPARQVYYRLEERNGSVLEEAYLRDIYNIDLNASKGNISYLDQDKDGSITTGDLFLLRSFGNGGLAQPGLRFRMVFETPEERTVGSFWLKEDLPPVNYQTPSVHWNQSHGKDGNISLREDLPGSSHFAPCFVSRIDLFLEFRHNFSEPVKFDVFLLTKGGGHITGWDVLFEPNQTASLQADFSFGYQSRDNRTYPESFVVKVYSDETGEVLRAELEMVVTYHLSFICMPSFHTGPLGLMFASVVVLLAAWRGRRERKPVKIPTPQPDR